MWPQYCILLIFVAQTQAFGLAGAAARIGLDALQVVSNLQSDYDASQHSRATKYSPLHPLLEKRSRQDNSRTLEENGLVIGSSIKPVAQNDVIDFIGFATHLFEIFLHSGHAFRIVPLAISFDAEEEEITVVSKTLGAGDYPIKRRIPSAFPGEVVLRIEILTDGFKITINHDWKMFYDHRMNLFYVQTVSVVGDVEVKLCDIHKYSAIVTEYAEEGGDENTAGSEELEKLDLNGDY